MRWPLHRGAPVRATATLSQTHASVLHVSLLLPNRTQVENPAFGAELGHAGEPWRVTPPCSITHLAGALMPSLEPKSMVTVPYPCPLAKERSQRSLGPPSAPNAGDPVPPSPLHCMPGPCSCPPERPDAFAAVRTLSQAKLHPKAPPDGRLRPTPTSRRCGAPVPATSATAATRPAR